MPYKNGIQGYVKVAQVYGFLEKVNKPRIERIQPMGAFKGYLSRPFVEFVQSVADSL
jgi:hypothetical protein